MRLYELSFVGGCILLALVNLAVPRFYGARHDFWPLFLAWFFMALAVGFVLHAVGIYIDRRF